MRHGSQKRREVRIQFTYAKHTTSGCEIRGELQYVAGELCYLRWGQRKVYVRYSLIQSYHAQYSSTDRDDLIGFDCREGEYDAAVLVSEFNIISAAHRF